MDHTVIKSGNNSSSFIFQVKQFTLKMNSLQATDEEMNKPTLVSDYDFLEPLRSAMTTVTLVLLCE
jgi:hypothetical protein